jgi:hypothetical protein
LTELLSSRAIVAAQTVDPVAMETLTSPGPGELESWPGRRLHFVAFRPIQMVMTSQRLLLVGALGSFAIAAAHVVIIFLGASAYTFFGAGDLAELAMRGSWIPTLLTSAVTLVLVAFGLYALAAVRPIRLPFARAGLWVVTGVYLTRGLALITQWYWRSHGREVPGRYFLFSLVALTLGLVHLGGVLGARRPSSRPR